ncbi:MAG: endonuclease/exonuclease/phosphatase [Acidimicrobiia bacterium]|nr:endonuclease/exonuclease/phosphatase [Acidimicrobiia bacterium]
MAQTFTDAEWNAIHELLAQRGTEFGLPERRDGSVVLGSFNIRKLGKLESKSADAWRLLAALCEPFDLIAVQEVQDDLTGLRHLKQLLGDDGWGMVSSDITGGTPGSSSPTERLAFLFRWARVERTVVASDISFDRSDVLGTLYDGRVDFSAAFDEFTARHGAWETDAAERKALGRNPKQKPVLRMPRFVTFIRQPLCVSFRVPGVGGAEPYEFLAVNAHLLYGRYKSERWFEFQALITWLIERAKRAERMYHPNIVLLGDCNFDLENVERRRKDVDELIKSINGWQLNTPGTADVNFPFLDAHPNSPDGNVFRTNARESQTYDQIGLVVHDARLPTHEANAAAGEAPDGFDYGVVNFVDLFAQAVHQQNHEDLTSAERKALYRKFEHDVTDHMPIWIRIRVPQAAD